MFGEVRSIPVAEVVLHSPRFGNNQEFRENVEIVDDLPFQFSIGIRFFKLRPDVKDLIDCGMDITSPRSTDGATRGQDSRRKKVIGITTRSHAAAGRDTVDETDSLTTDGRAAGQRRQYNVVTWQESSAAARAQDN